VCSDIAERCGIPGASLETPAIIEIKIEKQK
jgi:hypothetical protein